MYKNLIVLGLNFGDEGKGSMTHNLCKDSNTIVIRFSGGHQAGHTVIHEGKRHIFHSFGAGTFKKVPTFWSKYCTFYPTGMLRELNDIAALGIHPTLFVDPLAPVTTPYDVLYNQALELSRSSRHGSVGVGVGNTFERHDTTPLKLFAKDLRSKTVLVEKLEQIRNYYLHKAHLQGIDLFAGKSRDKVLSVFLDAVALSEGTYVLRSEQCLKEYDVRVFEGSQGILLDQDHGICFPHVTRAYTTSRNALEIIGRVDKGSEPVNNVYYMTRYYLTRHGRGPLAFELSKDEMNATFPSLDDKTNVPNDWQETLRYSYLNKEYFQHAIMADRAEQDRAGIYLNENICFTCMDQLKSIGAVPYIDGTEVKFTNVENIVDKLTAGMSNFIPEEKQNTFGMFSCYYHDWSSSI